VWQRSSRRRELGYEGGEGDGRREEETYRVVRNKKKAMDGGIKKQESMKSNEVKVHSIGIRWPIRRNIKEMLRSKSGPDGGAKKSSMRSNLRMNS
jgi:hypothetical protein